MTLHHSLPVLLAALALTSCAHREPHDLQPLTADNVVGIVVDPPAHDKLHLCYVPPPGMRAEQDRDPQEPRIMPFAISPHETSFAPGDVLSFTLVANWDNADTPVRIDKIRKAPAATPPPFSCDPKPGTNH